MIEIQRENEIYKPLLPKWKCLYEKGASVKENDSHKSSINFLILDINIQSFKIT